MKSAHSFAAIPLVAAIGLANHTIACDSVYTVNSLTDNGGLSFQEAYGLIDTNCGSGHATRIEIAGALANQNISFGDSFYLNTLDLEITGPESGDVTISITDREASAFTIVESGHLKLKNLTLDGGEIPGTSHAIHVETGQLDLDNVVLQNFYSSGNGAIIADSTANIRNSEFKNNSANRGAAIKGFENSVTISDSIFDNNRANQHGGAVYLSSEGASGTLVVSGSTFKNNTANNDGGAIYTVNNDSVEIETSVFENNSANAEGGALNITDTLTINNSTFKDNTADDSAGAVYIAHNDSSSSMDVDILDTVFEGNSTPSESNTTAGAIHIAASTNGMVDVSIDRTLMNNNSAYNGSGAIFMADTSNNKGLLQVTNSTFSNNSSGSTGTIQIRGGYADGTSISHSTIVNNVSRSGGSAVYGYQFPDNPMIEISHTIISGNTGGSGQVCSDVNEANTGFSIINSFISNPTTNNLCLANTIDDSSLIGSDENVLNPMLVDLEDNGGATKTFYPEVNSPVVDAGDANIQNPPTTDQRGNDRIMRGAIDIGAVEFGNTGPSLNDSLTFEDPALTEGEEINLDVSAYFTDAEGDALTFTATGLPNGVSISEAGEITGTINDSGNFAMVVRATDEYGAFTVSTFNISIEALPEQESSGGGSLPLLLLSVFGLLTGLRRKR